MINHKRENQWKSLLQRRPLILITSGNEVGSEMLRKWVFEDHVILLDPTWWHAKTDLILLTTDNSDQMSEESVGGEMRSGRGTWVSNRMWDVIRLEQTRWRERFYMCTSNSVIVFWFVEYFNYMLWVWWQWWQHKSNEKLCWFFYFTFWRCLGHWSHSVGFGSKNLL